MTLPKRIHNWSLAVSSSVSSRRVAAGQAPRTTCSSWPRAAWRATVRGDAPADLGAPDANRLTDNGGRRPSRAKKGHNAREVTENCERWRVRRPEFRSPWRRHEVRRRRREHAIRSSRAGVGCRQSEEVHWKFGSGCLPDR
jgi:hypothetical protein